MLDQALNWIVDNATKITICTSQPTTYNEATSAPGAGGYKLAEQASITSADFTGPAAGDTSGRKITVDQITSISIDSTGSAAHIAIVSDSSSILMFVTTATTQSLTAGNKLTMPAWDIEMRDAA